MYTFQTIENIVSFFSIFTRVSSTVSTFPSICSLFQHYPVTFFESTQSSADSGQHFVPCQPIIGRRKKRKDPTQMFLRMF